MTSHDHGIHSFEECVPEGSDYLQHTLEECTQEEAWLIIREEKMGAAEDQALTIQRRSLKAMRNTKDSTLEETLIHLRILIRNDEWRRWWRWRLKKESTHETNKDKYSIVISWYFLLWICLYSFNVLCMIECLH